MRSYYVKHNIYGINFTADSLGWRIFVFPGKKERDEWLSENQYVNGNFVAREVKAKYVRAYIRPRAGEHIVFEYNEEFRANELIARW